MSTLSAMNITSPWSSAKDFYHLKRRNTRGKKDHSRSSSRPLSSPASPFTDNLASKNSTYPEDDLLLIDPSSAKQSTRLEDSKCTEPYRSFNDTEKSSQPTNVPSWFGSLRSFAVSANSSSRGAFAPLGSLKTDPSISSRPHCRGRSSSIYYAGCLDGDDDDSDRECTLDEPITEKNGLKENRVRGPRRSWAMLDPSLGGFFPSSHKAVPGSDGELPSPTCSSSASPLHSPTFDVEGATISEAPYRDDDNRHDARGGGSSRTESNNALSNYEGHSNTATTAYPTSSAPSPTTSAFSLIKSYVPSLPSFQDSSSGSGGAQQTGAESSGSTGGFWSIRKLSLNLLSSSNQHASTENLLEDVQNESVEDRHENPYRDDGDSEETATPTSPSVSYFSSILGSATSTVGSKGSQLLSTQVRDNLEQLPVSSKSIMKIGRTD
ncbi:hypothetical protein BGZ79_009031 [Entomortierella chlamydospora]|nr:hypothetical protein BGZ79_009031 [Entomortierella chlamydospora]